LPIELSINRFWY